MFQDEKQNERDTKSPTPAMGIKLGWIQVCININYINNLALLYSIEPEQPYIMTIDAINVPMFLKIIKLSWSA